MNNITIGLVAHVDAGKTTLTEALLFESGAIRHQGRVDHKNAFLDTEEMEKQRGITIFSKLAGFSYNNRSFTLLDTPGHGDFSTEMERALWVMDAAVLIVSAADGITGQTELLWKLLERYGIPTFVFVNKMDRPGAEKQALYGRIQEKLDRSCVDFTSGFDSEEFQEACALCDEKLLDKVLAGGKVTEEEIAGLIGERRLFPVLFGSALKNTGIEELLSAFVRFLPVKRYPEKFGARIYKISRDQKGARLTWMKITGGSLKGRQVLDIPAAEETVSCKTDQIRIYSGAGFTAANEAFAGDICAVTGLTGTEAGMVLGAEEPVKERVLEPVLNYRVLLPEDADVTKVYGFMKILKEEDPGLGLSFDSEKQSISLKVMGKVQMEVITRQMQERFGVDISFGPPAIVYKETICYPVEGVGHFEPLRHYAEAHILIEPLPAGSGIEIASLCSTDVLALNWQRLIMTHLAEKTYKGVLTGSELTDVRFSVLTGRAHIKHTEGGDFRQATYRAVRQGLMEAVSVLLEPVYDFTLSVPEEHIGRAVYDMNKLSASVKSQEIHNGTAELTGTGPALTLDNYQEELSAYTAGRGSISCTFGGYAPCHNTEEVLAERNYDPDADLANPSSSVFCSHGAGFVVPWYQVKEMMHVESPLTAEEQTDEEVYEQARASAGRRSEVTGEELDEIFAKTFGNKGLQNKRPGWKRSSGKRIIRVDDDYELPKRKKAEQPRKKYLLVDGYNIIFAWDELKKLAAANIDSARDRLMDVMSGYQAAFDGELILVFDAYKVAGGKGSIQKYHNIYVVYTREAETADAYIEKTVHELGRNHDVTVATSDALEQVIILGGGAVRMSAAGLLEEVKAAEAENRKQMRDNPESGKKYLLDDLTEEVRKSLEKLEES